MIAEHYGHEITITQYSDNGAPVNFAIECLDCYQVLMDEDVVEWEVPA